MFLIFQGTAGNAKTEKMALGNNSQTREHKGNFVSNKGTRTPPHSREALTKRLRPNAALPTCIQFFSSLVMQSWCRTKHLCKQQQQQQKTFISRSAKNDVEQSCELQSQYELLNSLSHLAKSSSLFFRFGN